MRHRFSVAGRVALGVGALTMLVAVACGNDAESGSKSVSGSASGATAKATVDATGAITIVGRDNSFDTKEFVAKAGQKTTVTIENKGAALHNFQIKDQRAADGQEYQTPLVATGASASVEFTLPAGTYEYYCSVHPTEMRGKLRVE